MHGGYMFGLGNIELIIVMLLVSSGFFMAGFCIVFGVNVRSHSSVSSPGC